MKVAWIFGIVLIYGTSIEVSAQSDRFGMGMEGPCILQILTHYGDQLELTDEQKLAMVNLSLDNRTQRQRTRRQMGRSGEGQRERMQRNERYRDDGERRGNRVNDGRREVRERNERRNQADRGSQMMIRMGCPYQDVYEILSDEQTETLKSLLIEHVHKNQEYRVLWQEEILNRTGIQGERRERIRDILHNQSEVMTAFRIHSIDNSGEIDRAQFREIFNNLRESNQELKSILTVTEYEQFSELIMPQAQRHQPRLGRTPMRLH